MQAGRRQPARLRAALEAGPAAYGWGRDQKWTPARVAALVRRLFSVQYTLRGVSFCCTASAAVLREP